LYGEKLTMNNYSLEIKQDWQVVALPQFLPQASSTTFLLGVKRPKISTVLAVIVSIISRRWHHPAAALSQLAISMVALVDAEEPVASGCSETE
jgi:hypothetical protein